MNKPLVIVSVINDLANDNRVQRACGVLAESGFEIMLVGRRLPGSPALPEWPWLSRRMHLFFTKGPAFYFFFNLRLLLLLLTGKRPALLYANDLDTLIPNYLVSRWRKIPLVYDSHELFCDVPELANTPVKRAIWRKLESWIVPGLRYCITVNDSIAGIMTERYGVRFSVVRNIPDYPAGFRPKKREELALPEHRRIVLLQGAGINIGRGAEELVRAMKYVEDALLLIIGWGDVWPVLEKMAVMPEYSEKVKLIGRLSAAELRHFTANADLGVSIDKPDNLNYFYSLPNKLFDYIHAGVPVLCSRLPEIERIVAAYGIGGFIESHDPLHIAECIKSMLNEEKLSLYKRNTAPAAAALTWENEKRVLAGVLKYASETK